MKVNSRGRGEGKIAAADDRASLIPGLYPHAKYCSRLSARSALYTEFRLLLEGLEEPLPSEQYRESVISGNRLVRSSSSARKKLWKELHSRYILETNHPLYLAFWNEWISCQSEPERALTAYVLLALNDRLVTDLGTDWLFSHLKRGSVEIRVEDVRTFIENRAGSHPEVKGWSEETLKRVVRHYMASIRDFGLAKGKNKKITVAPALNAAPVRLLIRALRIAGKKPAELIHDPVFRLIAIDRSDIVDALGELHRRGELRFKMQADVIELELRVEK
ncbi:MAG: hypothetical protein CVU64_10365 [Deltaproteobacteria bacterium HGW-Deltaproteobacteria-21]|nr:MAG: hypothetical protein CVU64_10365 [Deltaproteobacteria bacterium HGW-Deltaproteobacteria-21]